MTSSPEKLSFDVVVIGAGGPGMTAALTAAVRGKRVALLEVSDKIGGTTVFSGGQVWVPNNHYMSELGVSDSPEEAIEYLKICSPNRTSEGDVKRLESFVTHVPDMAKFVEAHTPIQFFANHYPDVFSNAKGGRAGGRNLEVTPFAPGKMSGHRASLRYPPMINRMNLPLKWSEMHDVLHQPFRGMIKVLPRVIMRTLQGKISGSRALVAGLYAGCIEKGVTPMLNTRATELILDEGKVVGVVATKDNAEITIEVNDGVVLACGGFDWNSELKKEHLNLDMKYSAAMYTNRGDGLKMAQKAGAELRHLNEAWYWVGFREHNYYYEGAPLGSLSASIRTYPHTVIVNRQGARFGNEATLNFAYALEEKDEQGELKNFPCWVVFDHQFRRHLSAMEIMVHPNLPLPKKVRKFDSLEELCGGLGIDRKGLEATLERFNEGARRGVDEEWDRGADPYDQCYGNPDTPHPTLGTVEKPPFYAAEMTVTALGTRGGPATNERFQVLHEDGSVIPGLFAAGNVADCIMYYGCSGGDTLGPGLTAGYISGLTLSGG